jgi:hypothetical protein
VGGITTNMAADRSESAAALIGAALLVGCGASGGVDVSLVSNSTSGGGDSNGFPTGITTTLAICACGLRGVACARTAISRRANPRRSSIVDER